MVCNRMNNQRRWSLINRSDYDFIACKNLFTNTVLDELSIDFPLDKNNNSEEITRFLTKIQNLTRVMDQN